MSDRDLARRVWNWVWEKKNTQMLTVLALLAVLVNILGCRTQQMDIMEAEARGRAAALAEMESQSERNGAAREDALRGDAAREDALRGDAAAESATEDEARLAAKMLYGYYRAGASRADQWELIMWVAINRTESALYPNTLEEALLQPEQWQGFSEDSPVLQELYDAAKNAIEVWKGGGARPVAPDFIYLMQSGSRTEARTEFTDSPTCRYIER